MAHYRATVHAPWSVERAFEYMADLEHFAEWDPGVKRATQVVGEGPGLGAAYDVTVRGVGRDQILRYEIVEIEAPRRFVARAETGTLLSLDAVTIEADGDASAITYDATLTLKGVMKIGSPVLALMFRRIGDRALQGLRSVIEASTT
jgi:carbon monoxide dehydrogenase subunit G